MEKQLRTVHPVGINPGKIKLCLSANHAKNNNLFTLDTGHDSYLVQHKSKKLKNLLKSGKPSKKLTKKNSQIKTVTDSTISAETKPQFAWVD